MTLRAPEPLGDQDISDFTCGTPSLDDWLRRRARANQASGASRTFVACEGSRVVGYYALASATIACADATGRFRRNMPDPVPVVTLARLAIDLSYQRRGLGRDLVQDATRRILAAADHVGIRGMIVHAISDQAKAYYLGLGFVESPTHEMTLMISLGDLRESL